MNTVANRERRGGKRRRILSLGAIGGGICLIGAGALMAWDEATAPPVYQYVLGETLAAADLGGLAPLAERDVPVRRAKLVSAGRSEPLAELEVAESPTGPVLVKWNARVDDPFLTIQPPQGEVIALAEVLKRHVPEHAQLLAWWDHSRQLKLLSGVDVLFGQHLGTPLFLPQDWRTRRTRVESIEREFWGAPADAAEVERFQRFAQALLADEKQGMSQLRALAGGKRSVLVLHVRDAILLGQMAPEKIGVAFQDMGMLSDVHGMVARVHDWLDRHRYPAYAVVQEKNQPLRAVALTDAASAQTLAARLLPFVGNDQSDVPGATLVYRLGGFVVYEIAGDSAVAQSDEAKSEASR